MTIILLIAGALIPSKTWAQNYFSIQNAATNKAVVANTDRFTVFADWETGSQSREAKEWRFTAVGEGYYTIENREKSNHYLQAVSCCGGDATKIYNWNYGNQSVDDFGRWKLEPHPTDPALVRFKNKGKEIYMIEPAAFNSTNPLQLETDSPMQGDFGLNSYFRIVPRSGDNQQNLLNEAGNPILLEREYRYKNPSFSSQFAVFGIPNSCGGSTTFGANSNVNAFQSLVDKNHSVSADFSAENYGLAVRGDSLRLKVFAIGAFYDMNNRSNTISLTDVNNPNWRGKIDREPLTFKSITNAANDQLYYVEYPVFVNFGSPDIRLRFDFDGTGRYLRPGSDFLTRFEGEFDMTFPLRASGIVNDVIDSLGYTTDPELPYLVLRDPPGGASFAQIQKGDKICQSISQQSTLDQSGTVSADLKIGIAGEAGFIVTTAFEFSTTFSTSGTIGEIRVDRSNQGTCFEATETITTSRKASNAGAASDVYITMGYDLKYGIAEVLVYDENSCGNFRVDTQMVYTPIPGTTRTRLMSRKAIQEDIQNQLMIVADAANVGTRAAATAQYQVDAWKQFLELDSLGLIAAKAKPKDDGVEITEAGTALAKSFTVQTTEGNSIETDHYIDGTFGIQTKVEVAGSGFTAGFKYKTKKKFGNIQSSNETNTNKIAYTLQDNEGGDRIAVDIYTDPTYGTPVFCLGENSRTSCPYEGGLQRDQPRLEFSFNQSNPGQENLDVLLQTPDTLIVTVPPSNNEAVIAMNLCNDNPIELRRYRAQLLSGTNKAGAVVTLAGRTISADDDNLQDFTVQANSCDENFLLRLQKVNGVDAYENLLIRFFNECDTAAARTDYKVLSVFFQDNPVSISNGSLNLGALDLASRTIARDTVYIINHLPVQLTVGTIDTIGDFVYSFPEGEVIAPMDSIPVALKKNTEVALGPDNRGVLGLGDFTDQMTIGFQEIPETIGLTLQGTFAEGFPVLVPSKPIDFGEVTIGATKTDTIYLVNQGTAPMELAPFTSDIFVVPLVADRAAFTIAQFPTAPKETMVAPGDSQLVQITFAPTEIKAYQISVEAVILNFTRSNSLAITGTGLAVCELAAEIQGGSISCTNPSLSLQSTISDPGGNATISWTGPNGFTSSEPNPVVNAPGIYSLTLQDAVCSISTQVEILGDINLPDLSGKQLDTLNCNQLSLNLEASSETEGVIYTWTGPNGFESSEQNPLINEGGTYQLVATAPNGCQSSLNFEIFQDDQVRPTANFTANVDNFEVSFVNTTTPEAANYLWDFGNGLNSTEESPAFSYTTEGIKQVQLIASNECGADTVTQEVNIIDLSDAISFSNSELTQGIPGQTLTIPVKVKDLNNIVSLQLSVKQSDPSVARFMGVSPGELPEFTNENVRLYNDSTLIVVWFAGIPVSLEDDATIFNIEMEMLATDTSCTQLIFDSNPVQAEVGVLDLGEDIIRSARLDLSGGSVCGAPAAIIQGRVLQDNGRPLAQVSLSAENLAAVQTDLDGAYLFEDVTTGQDYTIVPQRTTDPRLGVSAIDLAYIQRHIIMEQLLDSPYKIIAADVDLSGSVSAIDLATIQRLILRDIDGFPNDSDSWKFVEAAYSFPDPQNPFVEAFPEQTVIENLSQNTRADFIGMKLGDVNNTILRPSTTGLDMDIIMVEKVVDDRHIISFMVPRKQAMIAYQFDINFDPARLKLMEVEPGVLTELNESYFGMRYLDEGLIPTLWYDPEGRAEGRTFEKGEVLFSLHFKAKKSSLGVEESVWTRSIAAEAFTPQGQSLNIRSHFQKARTNTLQTGQIRLESIRPNPFSEDAQIHFTLSQAALVQFDVFDALGRKVQTMQDHFSSGKQIWTLNANDLGDTGWYLVRMQSGDFVETTKIILQK